MNKANTNTQEFEELSIGTISGLQAFFRNAQMQYNLGLEKEPGLVAEGNLDYGEELSHAFQTVRHTSSKLIASIQSGGVISDEDAAGLQGDYDELVRVIAETKVVHVNDKHEKVVQKESPEKPIVKKLSIKQSIPTVTQVTESFNLKPKTGALNIASEDEDVVDVKDRLTISKIPSALNTVAADEAQKIKKNKSVLDVNHIEKIKTVIKQGQLKYEELLKKYKKPNLVQELLLEEIREGVEYLELLSKKSHVSKDQLSSVSEVASHIKYALEGVVDAEEIVAEKAETEKFVPVVTEQANNSEQKPKKPTSFVPISITTKKPSVAKRTVPKQLQTLPKPADIYGEESLTEKYLRAPKFVNFIDQYYSSSVGFEQLLDATITKIEADTIDPIEKWLGDLPASAFAFLKDMRVSELVAFADRSFEQVTADLLQQNIKFETFAAWRDMVDEMIDMVPNGRGMKFGQLFAHWMIQMAMQDD